MISESGEVLPQTQDVRAQVPQDSDQVSWQAPFQPGRAIAAFTLTAAGFGLYQWVRLNFWASSWLGIHDRIPWPAYVFLALALLLSLAGVRVALGLWSPHVKLGFVLLALLACAAIGFGGGRFASYTLSGTRNPPTHLGLAVGDRFPAYALPDQNGAPHTGPTIQGNRATLIYVYRGDFCPFARYELAELNAFRAEFQRAGAAVVAISADSGDRSKMLSAFLHSQVPLLSDTNETILKPLGLVQQHKNGEPDNAIPAFFIVDRDGIVRWIFTSRYYRELPHPKALLTALDAVEDRSAKPEK